MGPPAISALATPPPQTWPLGLDIKILKLPFLPRTPPVSENVYDPDKLKISKLPCKKEQTKTFKFLMSYI